MKIELAQRIRELPPYLFADIDRKKVELRKQGKDLIDLGIGDPDMPTPPHIVAAMQQAAANLPLTINSDGRLDFNNQPAANYQLGPLSMTAAVVVVALLLTPRLHVPGLFASKGFQLLDAASSLWAVAL